MIQAIADTHAVIWYLLADPRLSATARAMIDGAAQANEHIGVSSISLVELVYLQEKGRIAPTLLSSVVTELHRPGAVLVEVPVDGDIVHAMLRLPRSEVAELADRVIGATALHFGVPLLTRDKATSRSKGADTLVNRAPIDPVSELQFAGHSLFGFQQAVRQHGLAIYAANRQRPHALRAHHRMKIAGLHPQGW